MARIVLLILFLVSALLLRVLFFGQARETLIPKGEVVFEAVLKREPKVNDKGQVLKVSNVVIYTGFSPEYKAGERIRVKGNVDEKGRMFYPEIEVLDSSGGSWNFVAKLRQTISGNINRLLPANEAALVNGMVLGVDELSSEFRQQLVETGTIHVVVVSGQNLAIVAGIFLAMAKFLGRRNSVVLAVIAVCFYAVLAGFEPPVTRAVLMVLFTSVAVLMGRDVWPIWSLLMAAYTIVFFYPPAAAEISFQLTFAASLGIMTLGKILGKFITTKGRFLAFLGDSVGVAVSAYVFTSPIIYYYFGRISLVSPVVNVLVNEAVTPLMVIGFILAFSSLVWMPLAQLVAYLAYVPAWFFVEVVRVFANS